jgi:hypothetical protein
MSTSRLKLSLRCTGSLHPRSENGQKKEKSNISGHLEQEDSTVKEMLLKSSSLLSKPKIKLKLRTENKSSIQESVPPTNLKISNGKSNMSNQDIGSGLNWKRKGFETLLELIHKDSVSEVVVAYKDRLCRFGFELFEWICQKHNTKIVVLNSVPETEDRTKELAEDLFAIVNVFVAKNNGLRSSRNRQLRSQSQKDQDVPESGTDDQA